MNWDLKGSQLSSIVANLGKQLMKKNAHSNLQTHFSAMAGELGLSK